MTTAAPESTGDTSREQHATDIAMVRGSGPLRKGDVTAVYEEQIEFWNETACILERDMGWPDDECKKLCRELYRGLVCKSYEEDMGVTSFSPVINIVWRVAAFLPKYRPMCMAVFGYEINHTHTRISNRAKSIAATKSKYKELFSTEPSEAYWGTGLPLSATNSANGHKRLRDDEGIAVASSSKAHKGHITASTSSYKTHSRLTLMSDDTLVVYFETAELGKAVECIMSSTTKIGEFFDLIEQHIGLKDPRYVTAYDVEVNALDTCESLGLHDRDTVTLYPQ